MRNGDISNDMPKRFLVHIDVISKSTKTTVTKYKVLKKTQTDIQLDSVALSRFYIYTVQVGVTLELVSTSHTQEELDNVVEKLDAAGTNPFRYHSAYDDVASLVTTLPYHPEVMGVVDLPERLLMYGHWGYSFRDLFGGR
jgi:hypothetical protein